MRILILLFNLLPVPDQGRRPVRPTRAGLPARGHVLPLLVSHRVVRGHLQRQESDIVRFLLVLSANGNGLMEGLTNAEDVGAQGRLRNRPTGCQALPRARNSPPRDPVAGWQTAPEL